MPSLLTTTLALTVSGLPLAVLASILDPRTSGRGSTSPDFRQCLGEPLSLSCENKSHAWGLVMQTQFWSTYTGVEAEGQKLPKNSWTIHGLWPDNCDGSYESYCDFSRQYDPHPVPATVYGKPVPVYTGPTIDTFIEPFGRKDLIDYMNKYWIAQGQPNTELWAHEFSKHATCFSTFDTKCYKDYKEHEEVVNYFDSTVKAFKQYPTFKFLAAANIVPSNTTTFTLAQLQKVLKKATGATPYLGCSKNNGTASLTEVWYFSHSLGAPQHGIFHPVESPSNSSCPASGIHYYEPTASSVQ